MGGADGELSARQALAAALLRAAVEPAARGELLRIAEELAEDDVPTLRRLRLWVGDGTRTADAYEGEGEGESEGAGPGAGEGEGAGGVDAHDAGELAVALAEAAAPYPHLAERLADWTRRTASDAAPTTAPGTAPRTDNRLGGEARVDGPVVQAGAVHGGIHFHAATETGPGAAARTPAVPRQIGAGPAHFTSREPELAQLDRTWRTATDGPGLVVISGPPGVGKTALARHWLLRRSDAFPDGLLHGDLRGHSADGPTRPTEILGAFLRALGHDSVPAALAEQAALWRSVTADLRIAVLLDNALSAAQVRPLLPAGPASLTVVTSRGRLTGLGLDGASFYVLDVLEQADAVELLRRRVGEERIGREPEAALDVVEACGGLPLALCVAAAHVAARPRRPLAAMARALGGDEGQGALTGLRLDGRPAVGGALDESYRLLSPEVAGGYRRLSLAPVPVLGVAVTAAVCAVPEATAERLLDELAEVNLLEERGTDPLTGAEQYGFHDLVRAHAKGLATQHDTDEERAAALRRVVDLYLATATAAEALLTPSHRTLARDYASGPACRGSRAREDPRARADPRRSERRAPAQEPPFTDRDGALRWLDAERFRLMGVVRAAAEQGWHTAVWQLVDALYPLFHRLRPYDLWLEAHELGLDAARRAGDPVAESRMLTDGGRALRSVGRYPEALDRYGRALELARAEVAATAPDRPQALREARRKEAQALHGLAQTHRLAGQLTDARAHFATALALRERIGQRRGAALTRVCLGDIALEARRPDEARTHLERARADLLAEGDAHDAARALAYLGRASASGPDGPERAEDLLLQAYAEFEATGSVPWQGRVLEMLGETAEERGDTERARDWYRRSLARYETIGAPDVRRLRGRLEARRET
ncbi:ATP-binding protein [Streptomyces sp. NPDC002851]